MERVAPLNKKGLTLVEVLISMTVLLLVSLALMQTALVSIDSNMGNLLRDEAVSIAEMRMKEARNLQFTKTVDNLVSDNTDTDLSGANCPANFVSTFGTSGRLIRRDFKNITNFDFCTNMTVTSLNTDNKQIDITVAWVWKGESYNQTTTTIRGREQ